LSTTEPSKSSSDSSLEIAQLQLPEIAQLQLPEIANQQPPEGPGESYFPDLSLTVINSIFIAAVLGVVFMTSSFGRSNTPPTMAAPAGTAGESRPITARVGPDLRYVPVADVGIGFEYPYKSDLYALIEMSTGKAIRENTLPVYVDDEGERYVSGRYLVVTSTNGLGVYVRRTPHMTDRIRAWPDGTKLRSTNETTWSEDRYWFGAVDPAGNRGWVPSNYVRPLG
jgi:hypothetical protein